MDLIADIGATNSRCALLDRQGKLVSPEIFENRNFGGIDQVLDAYLDRRRASDQPRRAALAIAAPVLGDRVEMSNIDWVLSQNALKERLGLQSLSVINDFEALAWALPVLKPDHCRQIGGGKGERRATRAVLGPGSGLGVASLVPSKDGWTAVGSEGGHVTLAASTAEEEKVIGLVREELGHCSAERLLSGPGLVRLYGALARIDDSGATQLMPASDPSTMVPADVTKLAWTGDLLAVATLEMFMRLLATVASNLALTVGARGGIYIGGGIVPRIIEMIDDAQFRERFVDKGRYRRYLERIPTQVITDELPAMRGLRSLLQQT